MTEAETLRQCGAMLRQVAVTAQVDHLDGRKPCGEPIALVGEMWEHVDPKGPCAYTRTHGVVTCNQRRAAHSDTSHPHIHPVVQRGHQAIPGEER